MKPATQMDFTFRAFAEDAPGAIWQHHFNKLWPAYRRWFLRYGEIDRPTYLQSAKALARYMPDFVPIYEAMVDLAGGGDHAARFLAQYCPPPLFRGCSQAVYRADETVMVRSYDYSPYVFDGLLMRSKFGQREVIGMLDCMSGILDGINNDGLAVSMSFGGREEFGEGFGISIVLRYLLEFAGDVSEACELIRSIPIQGAYNIMLLDRANNFETVAVAAGQEAQLLGSHIATNHQSDSQWPLYEEKVLTHARFEHLHNVTAEHQHSAHSFTREFLQPPLYHTNFARGFGTLYDAAFYPQRLSCEYFWPHNEWQFDFHSFSEREYPMAFIDPEGYPENSEAYSEIYTSKPIPVLQF
jgi:predicted choloylglycine hydrolase